MDLKNFVSTLTLTQANTSEELGQVLETFEMFAKDFSNLVTIVQVNALAEADQDSLKSTFIYKWGSFIQEMQQFKANLILDTSVTKTITDAEDFFSTAYTNWEMQFVCSVYRSPSGWENNLYAGGFDLAALNALIPSPVAGDGYLIFYYPEQTSGNQYFVLKCNTASFTVDDTTSEILEANVNYTMGRAITAGLLALSSSSEQVDVEVDILAEYYPMAKITLDTFDDIITALALSS